MCKCLQDGNEAGCADSNSGGVVDKLKPQLDEMQLEKLLKQGPAAEAKVVRISGGIERLFGGWKDEKKAQQFKRRLDHYGSIWCCVNAHPGHIWYDFHWDVPDHQDRHGRTASKNGVWEPVTGP